MRTPILLILLLVSVSAFAQHPFVRVNGIQTDLQHFVCPPGKIATVQVDSIPVEARRVERHINISTKPKVQIWGYEKIADKFKLSAEDRRLPVCINKILMKNRDWILIDSESIIDVKRTSDHFWINVEDANKEELVINITVNVGPVPGSR